ncbi:MAG TPA: hypothetical protein VKG38_00210 [Solirubrobacteraceae bacterium]|nr:hypothetical protein [Solirubrobacteraceae bacterium]
MAAASEQWPPEVDERAEITFVRRMRRRCRWYVLGGLAVCGLAPALLVSSAATAHLAGLAAILLGISAAIGGVFWRVPLRRAEAVLRQQPQEMLLDRTFTPGVRVGAWKTTLRRGDGTSATIGGWQLASRQHYGAKALPVRVYGRAEPRKLVVVAGQAFTLVGTVDAAGSPRRDG